MQRRKAIRPLPVITSRWTAWAAQLASRHGRLTDVSRLGLVLLMPALARTLILHQQRWLSSSLRVQPQLNLSISATGVWNAGTNTVYSPQMTLLNLLSIAVAASRTPGAASEVSRDVSPSTWFKNARRADAGIAHTSVPRSAMTLAIARTSTEHLTTTLSRRLSVRREADFKEVTSRLTERVRRISETDSIQPTMALRLPPANRVTPEHISSQAMGQTSSFEKRSSSTSGPAMTMPPLNVELLADQVLKQIDRRVVARRERMGQI
jgi:hypothetical protein